MAVRWLLDDGPLNDLGDVFCQRTDIFAPGSFLIAEPVAKEAERRISREAIVKSAACEVFTFEVNSKIGRIFRRLRSLNQKSTKPTADIGEHYAIAWLLSGEAPEEVMFVATDKGALALALAELGNGHVTHSYQLWLSMFHEGLIDFDDLELLVDSTWKSEKSLPGRPFKMPTRPEV